MKKALGLLTVLCSLIVAGHAGSATLSLTPSSQAIGFGQAASVDLGINLGAAETLVGFDLALLFDPAVLSFNSFSYGGTVEADYLAGADYFPGIDPTAVLLSGLYGGLGTQLTNGSFTLGTFSFSGVGLGTSPFTMPDVGPYANVVILDIPGGTPGVLTPVTATASAGVVPEPGTLFLLGTGLIGLAGYARRRKRS